MTSSHKYVSVLKLPATHAIAIAEAGRNPPEAISAQVCERGCGSFLLPLLGKAVKADGSAAERFCPNAVDSKDLERSPTSLGVDADLALKLLRAIRMPTRSELVQEESSGYLRFGDPGRFR